MLEVQSSKLESKLQLVLEFTLERAAVGQAELQLTL